MITALAEAAAQLDSDTYRQAAETAAEFLWQHNRRGPGRLWRVHLDGRSSVVAAQEDYAYLAEALVALYDLSGDPQWLERASELTDALIERFLDSEGGGFYINETEAGITAMGRPRDDGADGAIPSGTSVALRVLQQLSLRSDDPRYRRQTDGLIGRFTPTLERQPHNFSYMLTAILDRVQGEMGAQSYSAHGGIRLQAELSRPVDGSRQLQVRLAIPPGWHVNSDQPGNPDLIGTRLSLPPDSGWQLAAINYPQGEALKLGFQTQPVSLYTGEVVLQARLEPASESPAALTLPVEVRLQACDERVCLPPEQVRLRIGLF
jgi:uncharacterized protein